MDLKLPPELDAALAREAKLAGKPKTALAQRAIESYIEEAAEYRAVLASRKRRGRTSTLAEVKKRLGLDR
jgi:predicted DNA-binding protein